MQNARSCTRAACWITINAHTQNHNPAISQSRDSHRAGSLNSKKEGKGKGASC
jgi:hypothetical protein